MRVEPQPRLVLGLPDQVPGPIERMRRDQDQAEPIGERLHLLKEALRVTAGTVQQDEHGQGTGCSLSGPIRNRAVDERGLARRERRTGG